MMRLKETFVPTHSSHHASTFASGKTLYIKYLIPLVSLTSFSRSLYYFYFKWSCLSYDTKGMDNLMSSLTLLDILYGLNFPI